MGGDNKSFLLLPTRGVLADESQNSQLSPAEEPSLMGVIKAQHSENEDYGIRSHHFMGNRWGNSGNSG